MALAKTTRAPYRGAFLAGARLARQCEPTDGQKAADWYEEGLDLRGALDDPSIAPARSMTSPATRRRRRGLSRAIHGAGRLAR
jgi:hypothetical protein